MKKKQLIKDEKITNKGKEKEKIQKKNQETELITKGKNDINKLNNDLEEELNNKEKIINEYKNNIQNLNDKINNLQKIVNDKEKKINEILEEKRNKDNIIKQLEDNNEKLKEEITNLKNGQRNIKIKEEEFKIFKDLMKSDTKNEKWIELIERIEAKEKEINEIKSRFPFELSQGEKLMSLIFISADQKIHHSFICKNTDKFTKIEYLLYDIYPEYMESDNYFIVNGNKINKYKTLEENKIKNSDIITLNTFDAD